jgi:hypothetical protein
MSANKKKVLNEFALLQKELKDKTERRGSDRV